MANALFYDIESLENAFTLCEYDPSANDGVGNVNVYYLVDDPMLTADPMMGEALSREIYAANANFHGTVRLWDLHYPSVNVRLAATYGLSDAYMPNNPASYERDSYRKAWPNISQLVPGVQSLRATCDTDPDYDESRHPYLMGYNSYNYDTTMLARYLDLTFDPDNRLIQPPSAERMRKFNDLLFKDAYKNRMSSALTVVDAMERKEDQDPRRKLNDTTGIRPDWRARCNAIRNAMLLSGRHVDVARLNEKQKRVGLKRLLGTLGLQILESDRLGAGVSHLDTQKAFYELIAYNVSDVVNLHELFEHPFYQGQFSLKRRLLQTYPELVYERDNPTTYTPVVDTAHVRRDRLCVDSSSAQFATKCLCPYDQLDDSEFVSFMYPSEKKAKELGIERRDILDESRQFFYDHFPQPELRAQFDRIYEYYANIRGKNFNDSKRYLERHGTEMRNAIGDVVYDADGAPVIGLDADHTKHDLSDPLDIPQTNTCLFYYDSEGQPTTCYVNFSVGGIHGIEYDRRLFDEEYAEWQAKRSLVERARQMYPDILDLRQARKVEIDGVMYPHTRFVKSGVTLKRMAAATPEERLSFWRDFSGDEPCLFRQTKRKTKRGTVAGAWDLKKSYGYTSTDVAVHEDFSSYYPSMLINMSAFENPGLGYDRYAEIYDKKQEYGRLMKDESLDEATRRDYAVQREGTKLILNSASGAANATFENNILMANNIISMRIIGQLMAWRIGQAQAYAGARIVSTNTDGLYSCGLDEELNNRILAEQAATIGIEIEPELMWLISKDANNRLEMQVATGDDGVVRTTGRVFSASGNLACHRDTNPTKALAHPAIVDHVLVDYLVQTTSDEPGAPSLDDPFDDALGAKLLARAFDELEPAHLLRMFGNVVASSPGTMAYVFASRGVDPSPDDVVILQHYNRMYLVKEPSDRTVHVHKAQAKKIPPGTIAKRLRDGGRDVMHDPIARTVLSANGLVATKIPTGYEAQVSKVPGIDPEQNVLIENRNLALMGADAQKALLDALDLDAYLELVRNNFERNWRHAPLSAGQ